MKKIPSTMLMMILSCSLAGADPQPTDGPRERVLEIVNQIQTADYAGDRDALRRLHAELAPFAAEEKLRTHVHYWMGFALWRRAINGFNDSAAPEELENDLMLAVAEFKKAAADAPQFADARIAQMSCLGFLGYMHREEPARARKMYEQIVPLEKELRVTAPDNPRLAWVLGPRDWILGPERGGGQDKAIERYERALPLARKQKNAAADPLEPTWGEPELLMSLAWSYLNRTEPDRMKAEQNARAALELVPSWHYVRDILMPQIHEAAKASASPTATPSNPKP